MEKMTYKSSGVDIDAGNKAVELIKKHVRSTYRNEVIGDLGGFAGFFKLDLKKYKNPVLVSGTDGVGTKIKIAQEMDVHDTIGIDLVAMCVNDILVTGAEPLFFLDYIACGKLIPEKIEKIVKGISEGCKKAGCSLIGGETAEMPGFYAEEEYDLAGFAVGAVDEDGIIDGSGISEKDMVIGISSSGLHSNGFSLVRKVLFEKAKLSYNTYMDELGKTLGEELLTPTKIYKEDLEVLKDFRIKGIAHITGGGLVENPPRVLKEDFGFRIFTNSWEVPPIFNIIKNSGEIEEAEMFRVFNMGIGLILVVSEEEVDKILSVLKEKGEKAFVIGDVVRGERGVTFCKK